jgi:RNA polymerase sigma-70 factor (ECF subfamily)
MQRAMLSCHDSLFRYARALTRDPAEAEELVQECYQRALSAKRQPLPGESEHVRRWMFVILRNVWKNQLRARGREESADMADELIPDDQRPSPEAVLLKRALQVEIRTALDSLTVPHREIIVLRDMEGLSYEQIGELLQCAPGTVMSRLARARAALAAHMEAAT